MLDLTDGFLSDRLSRLWWLALRIFDSIPKPVAYWGQSLSATRLKQVDSSVVVQHNAHCLLLHFFLKL